MNVRAKAGFAWVALEVAKSRHGLREDAGAVHDGQKREALRVGVRGETYACGG